jgi:hypothetical protein
MGFQSLFSALLCFVAAAHAGQLTVRSPRLTIFGRDGGQLSSEQYVTRFLITRMERNNLNRISLTKRSDPIALGPTDTLKLTFQVAEEATDNGVQAHQTFLRFFDPTTGEEGIQPVKIAPSGKAKFELVRCFVFLRVTPGSYLPDPSNLRTWPSRRVLSRLPVMRRFMFLSSSVPSCTIPRHSTSLTSASHRLLPHRYTQKKFSTTHAPSSSIPSAQTQNSLLGPSPRSSPRLFLPHGLSFSYW